MKSAQKQCRVALLTYAPELDSATERLYFPNYGARRVEAAVISDSRLDHVGLQVFDFADTSPSEIAQQVDAYDPDIVGISAFMWSLGALHPAARELKNLRPDRTIFYGGPSASPRMFTRAPYNDAADFVSAMATGDSAVGSFCDMLCLENLDISSLQTIPGIYLSTAEGWAHTGEVLSNRRLESTPSPYQMKLIPNSNASLLQTYVGCPFSCSYCAWGPMTDPKDILSVDYLVRELSAFKQLNLVASLLIDAGLNLNDLAFENLVAAEAEVGFFKDATMIMEFYPDHLKPIHLDFISSIAKPQVSVGLQSYDPAVLKQLKRPFDSTHFENTVKQLSQIAHLNIEIMVGLPGDNPDSFRRTFDKVRALPSNVRVYHCLVLPDALDARAPRHFDMDWDPVSLKMKSCLGWSREDLQDTLQYLTDVAHREGSSVGNYWWSYDRIK